MGLFRLSWNESFPAECRDGVATIGNFDGVHRGHLALLAESRRQASEASGPAVAVSFDPHPLKLLRPQQFKPVLTTTEDRAVLLQQAGADHVVLLRTTADLLQLTADDFFSEVVRKQLNATALVEGTNFGFGRNREGTIETLGHFCYHAGIPLTIVPPVTLGGQVISSSRVRRALEEGSVRLAADYLGRSYRLRGTVTTGQQRGRTIGFPTANLDRIETLIPRDGVYAVRVLSEGKIWPGAGNVGPNPTFGEDVRKVEIHLIGFGGDLLGKELVVDFLEHLRDTRTFSGVEELKAQLAIDIERAKQICSERCGAGGPSSSLLSQSAIRAVDTKRGCLKIAVL
jgi:riboflavin kinase/FMN adenylyltransferase